MSNVDPKEIAQRLADAGCPKPGEIWRHYKGGFYEIVAAAVVEATLEPAVVYRSLKYGRVWVRTLVDWREIVRVDVGDGNSSLLPRFRKVASDYATAALAHNLTEAAL